MGEYTTTLKFYKPAPTEFVDVNVQLNRNWDIADREIKRLLAYEYTTATVPNVTGITARAKFYKSYSNSLQVYFRSGNFFWQGPSNPVNSWVSADSWLGTGWSGYDEAPLFTRLNKRVDGGTKTQVEWSGAMWMDGSVIPANTNITVMAAGSIWESYRPAKNLYYTLWGGNATPNPSVYRLFIGSNGSMLIRRYGSNPVGSENYCELSGVKYDSAVTG